MWHDSIDNTSTSPTPSRKGEVGYAMGLEAASPQQPTQPLLNMGYDFPFWQIFGRCGGTKYRRQSGMVLYIHGVTHCCCYFFKNSIIACSWSHLPILLRILEGTCARSLGIGRDKTHPRARVASLFIRLPVCGAAWQPADHHVLVALRYDGAAWQRWRWRWSQ